MLSWQARVLKTWLTVKKLIPETATVDVQQNRLNLDLAAEIFRPMVPIEHIGISANGVPGEWVIPAGVESGRIIYYLHGGAYNAGSARSHRALAANIAAAAQARALVIDYRLAPEHPYPAALEDAISAYQWLLQKDISPKNIAVVGDSAGGGLTIALLIALRERGIPLPAAAAVMSPWTDLTASGESWQNNAHQDYLINAQKLKTAARLYLGDAEPHDPLASPLYGDLHGLPPLLIQVGCEEILLSDSTRLAENARRAGVEVTLEIWEGMQHVWHFAANILPEARQAIEKIGQFIIAKTSPR
jgi:acetyl esterase/lipase